MTGNLQLMADDVADRLRADPQRLWRLVRHARKLLFVDGKITTAEYVTLLDDDERAALLEEAGR